MLDIIQACAADVHPVTMNAIILQESGGNPYALNDNTGKKQYRPKSVAEAAAIARRIILEGGSVDIGLAQINSKNLPRLNLTVEQALDPCTNLKASQIILKEGWKRSGGNMVGTLSAYNTGKTNSTIGKNYAEKVFSKATYTIPAISPSMTYSNTTVDVDRKKETGESPIVLQRVIPSSNPFSSSLEPRSGLEPLSPD